MLKIPRVVSLSESPFVVSLLKIPFVVSLSNHTLREISQKQSQARQRNPKLVIPAKAGIHGRQTCGNQSPWIPACAGMTILGFDAA